MNHEQVQDVINLGIVIIDSRYTIVRWNRWMVIHSQKAENEMVGTVLFKHYPHLSTPSFLRSCKSVLKFGNFVFHSQKLHNYLFPFKPTGFHTESFDFMQQSCTLTPLKDEKNKIEYIVITVTDVTENVFLEKSLKLMSQQDGLTKTYNRRYLDRRLDEEYTRFSRKGSIFSLLMIDIDDFKVVNDSYGHLFGDLVLKELAQMSKNIIRGSDILARYGGEEFCIVLPDTSKEGALSFAERLRKIIEERQFDLKNQLSIGITVSIGVSQVHEGIGSPDELVDLADNALYLSKERGKNCVSYLENKHGDTTL